VASTAVVVPNLITSSNAHITVNPLQAVSIAYLRSLLDTTTWQPKDVGSVFALSNVVVISYTNITSGSTASYYVQDATAGINLFVTGDSSFRPTIGDLLSAAGTLSSFNNNLELIVNTGINSYEFYQISGHTNLLPTPFVFGDYTLTNIAGLMETNFEGRLVMLTNVGFTGSLTLGTANFTTTVTNGAGGVFTVTLNAGQDPDLQNRTLPRSAWTITGFMDQNLSGAYANKVYRINPTRFGDIVSAPPPAPTATATVSGNNVVLTWTAVPYVPDNSTPGAYAYSVLAATSVTGPYTALAKGLTFNTTAGTYTDTNGVAAGIKFYRISSP